VEVSGSGEKLCGLAASLQRGKERDERGGSGGTYGLIHLGLIACEVSGGVRCNGRSFGFRGVKEGVTLEKKMPTCGVGLAEGERGEWAG
jgi:hypothetical protein